MSEWTQIPHTTREDCIVDGSALTIADRNGGLDWHGGWYYARYASEPRRTADSQASAPRTRSSHTSASTGSQRNASSTCAGASRARATQTQRATVRRSGPKPTSAAPWTACFKAPSAGHSPPNPDYPDRILDRRTVYRWVATDEQLEWIAATLLAIAAKLPAERARAIRNWVTNVVDNDEPTE